MTGVSGSPPINRLMPLLALLTVTAVGCDRAPITNLVPNSRFNAGRPYLIWIYGNLWEFFMSAGFVPSVMVLGFGVIASIRMAMIRALERRQMLRRPVYVLLLSYLACVAMLDLPGLNRGETMRMWIFMAVFIEMLAAYLCSGQAPSSRGARFAGGDALSATATIYTVGVLLP
jgi:hypothetical protein